MFRTVGNAVWTHVACIAICMIFDIWSHTDKKHGVVMNVCTTECMFVSLMHVHERLPAYMHGIQKSLLKPTTACFEVCHNVGTWLWGKAHKTLIHLKIFIRGAYVAVRIQAGLQWYGKWWWILQTARSRQLKMEITGRLHVDLHYITIIYSTNMLFGIKHTFDIICR